VAEIPLAESCLATAGRISMSWLASRLPPYTHSRSGVGDAAVENVRQLVADVVDGEWDHDEPFVFVSSANRV
jgi:hypothetical protein